MESSAPCVCCHWFDPTVPKLAVLYLPAYFLLLELYPFTPSKLAIFFLASDSEPVIYVSGEAGHQYIILAHYRSPVEKWQEIIETSQFWHTEYSLIGQHWLKRESCRRIHPYGHGAKIGCFIFACLFSIFKIVSIHT